MPTLISRSSGMRLDGSPTEVAQVSRFLSREQDSERNSTYWTGPSWERCASAREAVKCASGLSPAEI